MNPPVISGLLLNLGILSFVRFRQDVILNGSQGLHAVNDGGVELRLPSGEKLQWPACSGGVGRGLAYGILRCSRLQLCSIPAVVPL